MYEARVLSRAGVDHGLVFVDSDHGFNLGHVPAEVDAQKHVVVARYEHDGHDWLTWNRLGRPASYRYLYQAGSSQAAPSLVRYTPGGGALRFEAEAEWPPLAIEQAWAVPDFSPCASAGRALNVRPAGPGAAWSLDWELAVAEPGAHHLWLGWVRTAGPAAEVTLSLSARERTSSTIPGGAPGCIEVDLGSVRLGPTMQTARLESRAIGMFDYVEVRP